MINTVLGKIEKQDLGNTRIHEHISWAWVGEARKKFSEEKLIEIILPHLKVLRQNGCQTIVEATPEGAGRNVKILARLSEASKLNIITNCGIWDGLDYGRRYVPDKLIRKTSLQIANIWLKEIYDGIDGTSIKPGIIKVGLGDNDTISEFQRTFLEAAIITAKETGLKIHAHICSIKSAFEIADIIEKSNLDLNQFVWIHSDFALDSTKVIEMAKKGAWIEMSWWVGKLDYQNWYIDVINTFLKENLLDKLLFSQDAGGFHDGEITPYSDFYNIFLKSCKTRGVSNEVLTQIQNINPSNILGGNN